MSKTVISLEHVTKQFIVNAEKVTALNDVSVEIREGSFAIIHGQSGSGKSTMLDSIVGLQEPTEGTVRLGENDFYRLSPSDRASLRARFFGVIYQRPFWIASMNVTDNVAYPLYARGVKRSTARAMAVDALAEVGMEELRRYEPQLLSGGQQQRVSLARALVTQPSVIVADEPTGSLDRANSELVMTLLKDAHERLGKTILLVTHDLSYLALGDHLIMLTDGAMEERRTDAAGV